VAAGHGHKRSRFFHPLLASHEPGIGEQVLMAATYHPDRDQGPGVAWDRASFETPYDLCSGGAAGNFGTWKCFGFEVVKTHRNTASEQLGRHWGHRFYGTARSMACRTGRRDRFVMEQQQREI